MGCLAFESIALGSWHIVRIHEFKGNGGRKDFCLAKPSEQSRREFIVSLFMQLLWQNQLNNSSMFKRF